MSNEKTIWCCPECGSTDVQSPEWCRWDVPTQQWIGAGGDPAGSEFWCEACEAHHRSLNERPATEIEATPLAPNVLQARYDALAETLGYCERWFATHSPTAPLINGLGDAEHPMLTSIRAGLAKAGAV